MRIIKRNGEYQSLSFDKILIRISKLANDPNLGKLSISFDTLAQEVISKLIDGITSSEIDTLTSNAAIHKSTIHPDYSIIASRIFVSNLQKSCPDNFSEAIELLYSSDNSVSVIDDFIFKVVQDNKELLNSVIIHKNDYLYDFFGLKTLERSYLLKNITISNKHSVIVETPQYLLMRVALGIHCSESVYNENSIQKAIETYRLTSQLLFTHATPTLFNSGTKYQQNSSCFLMGVEDSMSGIMKSLTDFALISKRGGGVGAHISDIRGKNSIIKGTNGTTEGITKMLKIFNETTRFANQGSKRNGSLAIYIEPHHPDILEFLELRLSAGSEERRARYLFYSLWLSDKFMECVDSDSDWYLLSSDECPGLTEAYGQEYSDLYDHYVAEGKSRETVKARDIWQKIIVSQIETGMPYMTYKDSVNKKSNQSNVGVIKSSNLCVAPETTVLTREGQIPISELAGEIVEVWNGEEYTKTTVVKTGILVPLLTILLSDGRSIDCTEYHKFYLKNGECVRAKDLVEFSELLECELPIIRNVYENTETMQWVQKIIDTGLIYEYRIEIDMFNRKFLENTRITLQSLGCNKIKIESFRGTNRLTINYMDMLKLHSLGLKIKNFTRYNGSIFFSKNASVISVVDTGRVDDTYCFTEKLRGMGVFNGILTGNCAEVMLVSDPEKDEVAVCNIATVSLPKCITIIDDKKYFDYDKLQDVVRVMVVNLNNVIDVNFYPIPETKISNERHRPIIIGTQGLSNTFFELGIKFESQEAKELNSLIFETIQYSAISMSNELAKKYGYYSTFKGSPSSKGIFQHNMWGVENKELSGRYDWDSLKEQVILYGLRNSMLTASPPTASTSQILGNYESFEPVTNNLMIRSTLTGDIPVINKYLLNDLIKINLWSPSIKDAIVRNKGSVQGIEGIPKNLQQIYKTVWEVSQKTLIDMSRDRGIFTDHSQSLNIFLKEPSLAKISSMHFYGWRAGLKTGMYYLRTKNIAEAQQFTNQEEKKIPVEKAISETELEFLQCSLDNRENCEMCSG
jgi:ribonucleotide reductase alpha subunit